MIPIIKWTLYQRRWSVFWWSLGIAVVIILNLSLYPSFQDQAALNEQLENLPEAARSLFTDTGDFFSPEGYLSSQVFYLMLPLLMSVLSIGLGSRLLAKEESDGTLELLLARPISRLKLLAAKALSAITILAIVTAVAVAATTITSEIVNINVPLLNLVVATLLASLLALLFGAVAFAVTTLGHSARLASVGIAALVGLGSYIVTSLANVAEWLLWPSRFLPYHYYRPGDTLYGNFHLPNIIGLAAAVLVLGFVAWRFFRRRDLNG